MPPKKLTAMTKAEFTRLLAKYLAIEGNTAVGLASDLVVTRMTIYRWRTGARSIDRFTADAIRKYFTEKLGD